MKEFKDIGLGEKILRAIEDMGYEEPTQIQEKVIPVILEGNDVIGQAQTGTGKTGAFGMPLVDMIEERGGLQALIILPTRELAIQVAGEISKFSKYKKIREVAIYGGQPIERQIRTIKQGVQVVIGTPGRILDHLNRRTLNFQDIKYVVLDEADEMLDMGFVEDIEAILKTVSQERQTLLFSATMPKEIRNIAHKYMNNPTNVSVMPKEVTVSTIDQYFITVSEKNKIDAFTRILDANDIPNALVFCRTKRSVDELVESLQTLGYAVEGIHGDYNQNHRINAINKFKDGTIDFLIATDVAARGLDIENISHVFNYHIPENPEIYVHRIGRTGRAGKSGTAITFVQPREYKLLKMIEKFTRSKIVAMPIPNVKDVHESKVNKLKTLLLDTINKEKLGEYRMIVEQLGEDVDLIDVCSAALKLVFEEKYKTSLDNIEEIEEKIEDTGIFRLFINIGREASVKREDIAKLLLGVRGINDRDLFEIDIFDRFSFVNVTDKAAKILLSKKTQMKFKGKRVSIALAKTK